MKSNLNRTISKNDVKSSIGYNASSTIYSIMEALKDMRVETVEEKIKVEAAAEALKALFLELSTRN